jgi:hypothetical protein
VVVLDDAQASLLCQMSPATIDRRLAAQRRLLAPKGRELPPLQRTVAVGC